MNKEVISLGLNYARRDVRWDAMKSERIPINELWARTRASWHIYFISAALYIL